MLKVLFVSICISLLTICSAFAQTQKDTIYTLYTATPVIVDGLDADAVWAKADWHDMKQVWLGNAMEDGDFIGKYKTAWDKNFLYILVEVVDDSLSDDHKDPLDNYWNDDCVELFIDEDHSRGNHQNNNNAFAYHCSTFYDVIDGAGSNGATINCRNNITIVMDTIGEHTYLWEFAVKMYNKNFTYSNPDQSRVYLSPEKLMGFSIAYCDNDETTERENFIGSVVMPKGHENDSYINADYFGTMLLVDPGSQYVSSGLIQKPEKRFTIYPNPVVDELQISCNEAMASAVSFEILSVDGKVIRKKSITNKNQSISLNGISSGVYMVRFTTGDYSQTETIVVR
jgi:hypothetical protein